MLIVQLLAAPLYRLSKSFMLASAKIRGAVLDKGYCTALCDRRYRANEGSEREAWHEINVISTYESRAFIRDLSEFLLRFRVQDTKRKPQRIDWNQHHNEHKAVAEMVMPLGNADDVRQQALLALTASFVSQGHPAEYAKHMAMASIFQADLELRNAQMTSLIAWLREDHPEVHDQALHRLELIRQEFEQRVQQRS